MLPTENDIYASHIDNELALESLDRTFLVLEQLVSLQETLQDKHAIDDHDLKLLRIASEMAVAGTEHIYSDLLPSLEHYGDPSIAIENISETVATAIKATTKHFGNIFMAIVDTLEMAVTLFERQSRDIEELQTKLKNGDFKTDVTLRSSKYFLYDQQKTVDNLQDYVNQLQFTLKECSMLISAVNNLQRQSLFQSVNTLLSFITGYDTKYLELFLYLEDFIKTINKIPSVTQYRTHNETVYYRSKTYLGLAYIQTSTPKPNSYDRFSVPSAKLAANSFTAKVYRDTQLDLSPGDETVEFTNIKLQQLNAILTANMTAIDSYKQLLSLTNKLSNLEALFISGEFIVNLKQHFVLSGAKLFFDNYRILLALATTINATTGTVFNLTRGNITTGNRVVRHALK